MYDQLWTKTAGPLAGRPHRPQWTCPLTGDAKGLLQPMDKTEEEAGATGSARKIWTR